MSKEASDLFHDKLSILDVRQEVKKLTEEKERLRKHTCHVNKITKGVTGEFSKIQEEFEEAKDAFLQGSGLMLLIELADLIGAIERFLVKRFPGVRLEDLIKQMEANHKLFDAGVRLNRDPKE